jgi:WD40 repeat protein
VITEPLEISHGGAASEDVMVGPTTCGFPEMPTRTVWPDEIDYIGEASGMADSRQYPGVYWVVRDSGHTAAINAVRFDADGMAHTKEILVDNAVNGDWEEITYTIGLDGVARLWVVDNGGPVNNKKIYEIIEPDPDAVTSVSAVNEYRWAYPGSSFNTEAAFMARGYLVLVTKTSPSAQMYRFETLKAGVVNKPTYIGKLMNSHSVSVARQSPDGKILVTASHEVVNLYRSTDGSGSLKSVGGKFPDCQMRAFPGEHVEAGEFVANRQMRFVTEIKRTFLLRID